MGTTIPLFKPKSGICYLTRKYNFLVRNKNDIYPQGTGVSACVLKDLAQAKSFLMIADDKIFVTFRYFLFIFVASFQYLSYLVQ